MQVNIQLEDLKEIEDKYNSLTQWLIDHFCSFPACAFILETVFMAVEEAKTKLIGEDNE